MADTGTIYLLTMEYPPMRGGAGVYCEELYLAAKKDGISIQVIGPKTAKKKLSKGTTLICQSKDRRIGPVHGKHALIKNLNLENHTLHLAS